MHTQQGRAGETDVVRRAYETLRPLLVPEASFRTSVSDIARREVHFSRARARIERRTIERCWEPAQGAQREDAEPLITPRINPWTVELLHLPVATRQLCLCEACGGRGATSCSRCQGTALVHTWLEVERSERIAVRSDEPEVATYWLPHALDADDFDRSAYLHRLESDEELDATQIEELSEQLLPTLDHDERIVEVRLQRFAVEVHDVRYQTALGTGTVELAGAPLTAFGVVRAPVVRRHFAASCAFLLGAALSTSAAIMHRTEHAWHREHGHAGALVALGLGASALLGISLLGWLRARSQRTVLSTVFPSAGALLLAFAAFALHTRAQPSLSEAQRALTAGDLPRTELTLDALTARGEAPAAVVVLRDDVRLTRMANADFAHQLALARAEPWSSARGPRMKSLVRESLEPQAIAARRASDPAALRVLSSEVAPLLPEAAQALTADAAAIAARVCLQREDTACAEQALLELGKLGANDVRARVHARVVEILNARLEQRLAETTRAGSASVLHDRLAEAHSLCTRLDALGKPAPRATCMMVARSLARAEQQLARSAATTTTP